MRLYPAQQNAPQLIRRQLIFVNPISIFLKPLEEEKPMLQKLRSNKKGFTLIELMIVIAIIGILAAIAIPNFIAYRNKAYCSAVESDAQAIIAGLADYYSIPGHAALTTSMTDIGIELSNANQSAISGTLNAIVVSVTDGASRCPTDYQAGDSRWSGTAQGTYTITMQ
jgi:prepilin-type N-terminal cleavage/methylation domain-containing protein